MKKTILTLALAVVFSAGVSINAQTTNEGKQECPVKTCELKKECDKVGKDCEKFGKDCKKKCDKVRQECDKVRKDCKKECDKVRKDCKKRECKNPAFKGIELTADQQEKIAKLNQERREKAEEAKVKMKEERRKGWEEYDQQIATILTTEQLATYNANKAEMKAKCDKEPKHFKVGKPHHKMRRDYKGDSPKKKVVK